MYYTHPDREHRRKRRFIIQGSFRICQANALDIAFGIFALAAWVGWHVGDWLTNCQIRMAKYDNHSASDEDNGKHIGILCWFFAGICFHLF